MHTEYLNKLWSESIKLRAGVVNLYVIMIIYAQKIIWGSHDNKKRKQRSSGSWGGHIMDTRFEPCKQEIVYHLIWASFGMLESFYHFFLIELSNSYHKSEDMSPALRNMQSTTKRPLSLQIKHVCICMCLGMCRVSALPIPCNGNCHSEQNCKPQIYNPWSIILET